MSAEMDSPDTDGHKVTIYAGAGEGTMACCSCRQFSEFDSSYHDDFDALAILVTNHRSEAARDEREAERMAEIQTHRYRVWVESETSTFVFTGVDELPEAEWLAEGLGRHARRSWIEDSEGTP